MTASRTRRRRSTAARRSSTSTSSPSAAFRASRTSPGRTSRSRAPAAPATTRPNVGGHSVIRMMDIGTADEPNCSPGLPILAVTNKADPRDPPDLRPGPRHQRRVGRPREVPRPAAARPRRPRAVLPRRPGEEHQAPPSVTTRIGSTSTSPTASGRTWKRSWGPSRPRGIPSSRRPRSSPRERGRFFHDPNHDDRARGDKETPPATARRPGSPGPALQLRDRIAPGDRRHGGGLARQHEGVAGFEKRVVIKTMLTSCSTGGSWSTCSSAKRRWPPA